MRDRQFIDDNVISPSVKVIFLSDGASIDIINALHCVVLIS